MAKVLIIDDSKTILAMAKAILEEAGHTVLTAEDGQSGLDLARQESPALIILDVMLPRLDGYQVCRMLKFDEKYKSIPIIMFTSKASEEDRKIGEQVGANTFLTKDFDPSKLLEAVNQFVK